MQKIEKKLKTTKRLVKKTNTDMCVTKTQHKTKKISSLIYMYVNANQRRKKPWTTGD